LPHPKDGAVQAVIAERDALAHFETPAGALQISDEEIAERQRSFHALLRAQ